jgi:hypothetical protein
MKPVQVLELPHNGRGKIYGPGEGPSFPGEVDTLRAPVPYANLPIPMPALLSVWTLDDRVIAAWADDAQIRWQDLDTVVMGVEQYNEDCRRLMESEG